jgi:hypothetical protein
MAQKKKQQQQQQQYRATANTTNTSNSTNNNNNNNTTVEEKKQSTDAPVAASTPQYQQSTQSAQAQDQIGEDIHHNADKSRSKSSKGVPAVNESKSIEEQKADLTSANKKSIEERHEIEDQLSDQEHKCQPEHIDETHHKTHTQTHSRPAYTQLPKSQRRHKVETEKEHVAEHQQQKQQQQQQSASSQEDKAIHHHRNANDSTNASTPLLRQQQDANEGDKKQTEHTAGWRFWNARSSSFRFFVLILIMLMPMGPHVMKYGLSSLASFMMHDKRLDLSYAQLGSFQSAISIPSLILPLFGGMMLDVKGSKFGTLTVCILRRSDKNYLYLHHRYSCHYSYHYSLLPLQQHRTSLSQHRLVSVP